MDVNRIIYTYKKPKFKIYTEDTNQVKWLTASLKSIEKLGYVPTLYTDDLGFASKFNIDTHIVREDYDYSWEGFKMYVLETELKDDYFISDNDIIYKSRIDFDDSDLFFDGIETKNWDWVYSKTIKYIKDNSIIDRSYWINERMGVFNMGIIRIPNQELKKLYINEWKYLHNLFIPHHTNLNPTYFSVVLTQYLLTLLSKNYSYKYFSDGTNFLSGNKHYTHYCGYLKIKNMPTEVKTLL